MADCTTFRLGGPCPVRIDCATPLELAAVLAALRARGLQTLVIGQGSNLLVADEGLDRPVVRYLSGQPLIRMEGDTLVVGGATRLEHLVRYTLAREIATFLPCTGIPGTVGGSVAGNAGAFGWQLGDDLVDAELFDPRSGRRRTVPGEDMGFGYRTSALRDSGEILLSARFRCTRAPRGELIAEHERLRLWRVERHPDLRQIPCAGSFFRNIEPTSRAERRQAAGWFLAEAGALAMRCGGAAVFARHANMIIKADDTCTTADVRTLAGRMAQAVQRKFGLTLHPEVRYIGPSGPHE